MKTISLILLSTILFSCSRYTLLTSDYYNVINRDQNTTKLKAKFEKSLQLELIVSDTIVSTMSRKETCDINYINRPIESIPEGSYVKLKESTENTFIVEFVDYKISLPMILSKDGDFIINCDKNGIIPGSRYKVQDNNPVLLFKMKKKKTTQEISLKK